MDNEERLAVLEKKVAAYDTLIVQLVAYARTTPKGRLMLRMLGIK